MIEDREAVPPCRITKMAGVDCDIVLTERPRFTESFNRISIAPKPNTVFVPNVTRAPGRPRVEHPKKKPIQNPGSGKGSNFRQFPQLTVEKILALKAAGMKTIRIAIHFGCGRHLILHKLRMYERAVKKAAGESL